MTHNLRSYLRTYRKRASLTQEELACLLGLGGREIISRYERLTRKPALNTAIACQVIFDAALHELFPGLYEEVENVTLERMTLLLKELEEQPPRLTVARKCDVLRHAIKRAHLGG